MAGRDATKSDFVAFSRAARSIGKPSHDERTAHAKAKLASKHEAGKVGADAVHERRMLSHKAYELGHKARTEKTPEAYKAAAAAHQAAAVAHRAEGSEAGIKKASAHEMSSGTHGKQAAKGGGSPARVQTDGSQQRSAMEPAAGKPGARSSAAAEAASKEAARVGTGGAHATAQRAHTEAASAQRDAGNHAAAQYHDAKARQHAVGGGGKPPIREPGSAGTGSYDKDGKFVRSGGDAGVPRTGGKPQVAVKDGQVRGPDGKRIAAARAAIDQSPVDKAVKDGGTGPADKLGKAYHALADEHENLAEGAAARGDRSGVVRHHDLAKNAREDGDAHAAGRAKTGFGHEVDHESKAREAAASVKFNQRQNPGLAAAYKAVGEAHAEVGGGKGEDHEAAFKKATEVVAKAHENLKSEHAAAAKTTMDVREQTHHLGMSRGPKGEHPGDQFKNLKGEAPRLAEQVHHDAAHEHAERAAHSKSASVGKAHEDVSKAHHEARAVAVAHLNKVSVKEAKKAIEEAKKMKPKGSAMAAQTGARGGRYVTTQNGIKVYIGRR